MNVLSAKIDDPDRTLLVTVRDVTEIVEFADLERNDEAALRWLHVDQGARGEWITLIRDTTIHV